MILTSSPRRLVASKLLVNFSPAVLGHSNVQQCLDRSNQGRVPVFRGAVKLFDAR